MGTSGIVALSSVIVGRGVSAISSSVSKFELRTWKLSLLSMRVRVDSEWVAYESEEDEDSLFPSPEMKSVLELELELGDDVPLMAEPKMPPCMWMRASFSISCGFDVGGSAVISIFSTLEG